jgi:hypothetical protein
MQGWAEPSVIAEAGAAPSVVAEAGGSDAHASGVGGRRAAGGAELRPAGPAARGGQEWAERGRWSRDGRREAGEQGAGGCVLWEEEGRAGGDDEGKRSTSLYPIERKMTGNCKS